LGARYYAPWLGLWVSCDPAGNTDGLNLYARPSANRYACATLLGRQEVPLPIVMGTPLDATAPMTVEQSGLQVTNHTKTFVARNGQVAANDSWYFRTTFTPEAGGVSSRYPTQVTQNGRVLAGNGSGDLVSNGPNR
jgi:hypothetical protein